MTRRTIPVMLLLAFLATTASAQMMGGGFNPFGMLMGGFDLPVASDGTVFVTRNVTGGGVDLAAINPDGSDRWTFRLQMPMTVIAVNDTTAVIGWIEIGGMMQNSTQKTHLFALSLTEGKQLGKLDVDGVVAKVSGYKSGFYAQFLIPDGASSRPGFLRMTRKLVALDNNGNQVWEKTLD